MYGKILCFFMWLTTPLLAFYNGNPSFPMMPEEGFWISKESWLTLKGGYEWDDLFDQRLTLKKNQEYIKRCVGVYQAMSHFGTVTVGFNDRVELYSALGSMSAKSYFHPYSSGKIHYETSPHFAWYMGGRAILAYWGDIQLGIDAKYGQFNPDIKNISVQTEFLNPKGISYQYRQWQIGLGSACRIGLFAPYLGVKYSNVRLKFKNLKNLSSVFIDPHVTMKNRFSFGLFIGCGVSLMRALNLNIEGRVIDEMGLTVSGDIRF